MRKIDFTEEERLKGLNHIDLGEDGDFYAEYFIENNGYLMFYGWWDILEDEELAQELGVDPEDGPFWARISFIPDEWPDDDEDIEYASDWLAYKWFDWTISITEEVD